MAERKNDVHCELHFAMRATGYRRGSIVGQVKGDTLGRYKDGDLITTSPIVQTRGSDVFITASGTAYQVMSWREGHEPVPDLRNQLLTFVRDSLIVGWEGCQDEDLPASVETIGLSSDNSSIVIGVDISGVARIFELSLKEVIQS